MTEFMAPGKMKIIKHHSKSACEVKVPMYPKDEDAMNEPLRFALNRDLLREKFDSPEHCALWLFPYRTIVFKGLIKFKIESLLMNLLHRRKIPFYAPLMKIEDIEADTERFILSEQCEQRKGRTLFCGAWLIVNFDL